MPVFPTSLPAPRTPDPMDAPALRWGVMGTGWIAERFVGSVRRHTRQVFTAVASRDASRAKGFADRHGVPRAYGSYEELAASADVDVVYVATEHTAHLGCARISLTAGKHTLVEKPLALDATQAAEIARLATERGLFCAEALWTFFLPRFDVVRQVLGSGVLGEVRTVWAEHGEHFTAGHRILRADLAGGPLLDLGTYPVSLAVSVLGEPVEVQACAQPHPSGVNGQTAALLRNAVGAQGIVHTTLFSDTPTSAAVAGTHATLSLPGPFPQPGEVLLAPAGGGAPLSYTEPLCGHDALYFEAAEVARCIQDGRLQTPLRPLSDSVATLGVMDEIRRLCGISFPRGGPGHGASLPPTA
ncbi:MULTISPECIES: Gfo/Idh/MocA family protein [Streptomyces]|uniref:Putative dehydrogenase n=1 Tax=Streptomyces stelliscabiei TaxID=146820 RepID=A0A8I0PAU9_9ACTN|nr:MULTISPECIES: Gfo/Idh/MocA family oxidoreductase [Streptomyces]KND41531.1 oxidoreductase [Streptomyces stelliscabiei]MBE1601465.1 putative dehydrogenase [Streptomyces stelliscabiei]MDX2515213.1 Gfo/Idh/MocA family oxidoreductase [Streptomyces stelliscabiei]MDX2555230.1 Gfo/Idh/MocA family oxidoreductase [Streptomyces stelliscabiei]MDX2612919.1 Gfo/Idh/MocA family oxidoreductase [Streptomyces stelliscabiei]